MNLFVILLALSGTAPAPDGALLFLENSNRIVEYVTGDDISHVAIVMRENGRPLVYEATPAEVRRVELSQYYDEISQLNYRKREKVRVWVLSPQRVYEQSELDTMKEYLDSQLGRRYSVKNFVRGRPGDGIHCSELVANTLSRGGVVQLEKPYSISPGALYARVKAFHDEPVPVVIEEVKPEGSWCARCWKRWTSFTAWCAWSCYECWTFCQ